MARHAKNGSARHRVQMALTMPHAYAARMDEQGHVQDDGRCRLCRLGPRNVLHTSGHGSVLIANRVFLDRALKTHDFEPRHRLPAGYKPDRSARCTLCGMTPRAKIHNIQGVV